MLTASMFSPIPEDSVDLLIIAGEASGDEHAALIVKQIKMSRPTMRIVAIGGETMKESGAHLLFNLVEHAVVGVFEVLRNYPFFKKLFQETIDWIQAFQPKAILLVDYPGFNLRLAESLRKLGISQKGGGKIRVLQYVSPQLWAWKPRRRFKMANVLDGLGVIFPFEVNCYDDVDLPVHFVGHPFLSKSFSLPVEFNSNGPILLLPGCRLQPIRRILPPFLKTYRKILTDFPEMKAQIPMPNSKLASFTQEIIQSYDLPANSIQVCIGSSKLQARFVLMSSGTMSFACALAGIPGIIAYMAHPLTYLLGRWLINVPHLGMANILLPKNPPYPEFVQGEANAKAIFKKTKEMLSNSKIENKYFQVSNELKDILTQDHQRDGADWLLEESGLTG